MKKILTNSTKKLTHALKHYPKKQKNNQQNYKIQLRKKLQFFRRKKNIKKNNSALDIQRLYKTIGCNRIVVTQLA